MSYRLYKESVQPVSKRPNILRIILLVICVVLFTIIWIDVFVSSKNLHNQIDKMVEGKDYFREEISITKKDTDSYYSGNSTVESKNYYFYYDISMQKKMFVDEATYNKYNVGDKITAYTTDHSNYGFTKDTILPARKDKMIQLKNCLGAILGAAIVALGIAIWIKSKDKSSAKK